MIAGRVAADQKHEVGVFQVFELDGRGAATGDAREADAAQPEDDHAIIGRDVGAVDRGADTGEDRTAEERGDLVGQLGVDLDRRVRRDDNVVGEG